MIVIADESKWVPALGRFPLPIEVVPFGLAATRRAVEAAAAAAGCPGPALLRRDKDGHAFVTDGGHWILDAALERIADPKALAERLSAIPGVVEHGLFIGLAQAVVLGRAGRVSVSSSGSEGVSPNRRVIMSQSRSGLLRCRDRRCIGVCCLRVGAALAQQPYAGGDGDGAGADRRQGRDQHVRSVIPGVIEQAKNLFLQTNPSSAEGPRTRSPPSCAPTSRRAVPSCATEVVETYACAFHRAGAQGSAGVLQDAARQEADRARSRRCSTRAMKRRRRRGPTSCPKRSWPRCAPR